ncbi:hypothetical protein BEI02_16345 [Elizabethkingia sp. HvH-WGS333]|uniref:Uncharacterized protein n=3 Tax=Weeksellaceae TaxID=2762318 RepID=A0A455ZGX3_9FLAO|nr:MULTISPECIES: hypothetical protein [Elizabethkingia]HAY3555592.1 hypothetical protein [Elizabethkingia meningoseptica]AIL45327.1 hypothetical protein BD94_1552 [Elizabethkingia anophelis NUHP1]MCL1641465.1 hypothetical protein [Elizabethkingia anophelis]MCL1646276.1 hypothetical protein [Elizabethkingia anophelis]MCT3940395.1 hypothetical protein [Elizabethkingia anophelis]
MNSRNKFHRLYGLKKKIFLRLFIPVVYVVLTSSGGGSTPAWQKENVSFPMMNIEINATMKEHDRQKEMRKNQALNAGIETTNRSEWNSFKDKVTKVQDRLRIVSFALQAIPTGVAMSREVKKITQNQASIIDELSTAPYSIITVLPSGVQYVDDLQMVTRLITGIILSYGAINQMEKSERKILLDYALGEVKTLSRNSTHMLLKIRDIKAKVLRNKRAFQYYVNRDRQVVENIMKNIKSF